MWRRLLAGLAAVASVAAAGCADGSDRRVRVAVVGEFTGPDALASIDPVRWAFDEVRAAGGLAGTTVELVPFDLAARDLADVATVVGSDTRFSAVIGPWRSTSALAAGALTGAGLVVVSPGATSAEVGRAFGSSPMFFRTAPSDALQVRALLDRAEDLGAGRVALLTSVGPYGDTFLELFGLDAAERAMTVTHAARFARDTEDCASEVARTAATQPAVVVVALAHRPTVVCVVQQWAALGAPGRLVLGDRAEAPYLLDRLGALAEGLEGVAPDADPATGFASAYRQRFAGAAPALAANAYDAGLLVALGLDRTRGAGGAALAEALDRLTTPGGERAGYDRHGIAAARAALDRGSPVSLVGASGPLRYDGTGHVDLAQATYRQWRVTGGGFTTIGQVTASARRPPAATRAGAPDLSVDGGAPTGGDTWALLVAASSGWANYRHQADVLAFYQLLRRNGVPDERIVLVAADDLADDPRNPTPGEVRQRPDGPDLRAGARIDLRLDQIDATALTELLTGTSPSGERPATTPGPDDHLLVFIAGHGNHDGVLVGASGAEPAAGPGTSMLTPAMLDQALEDLATRDGFARTLVVVEACMSGVFADGIDAPGVMTITAASATEASLSTNRDPRSGVWLADEMSAQLLILAGNSPDAALDDAVAELYEAVRGSHVQASAPGFVRRPGSARLGDFVGEAAAS